MARAAVGTLIAKAAGTVVPRKPPEPTVGGVLPRNLTVTRLVHPENAEAPRLVTEAGISIVARLVQLEKAELPIVASLDGRVIDASALQPEKAPPQ